MSHCCTVESVNVANSHIEPCENGKGNPNACKKKNGENFGVQFSLQINNSNKIYGF